ncbi:glycoside hydrolase family 27 protein [Catenovulum maritimum]|uniref:Alpha-galactosidase n=1 Tax=Catenovulum maritimum TaxID=1513271 RepID=A0A0J8GXX0_9ALTE|nr:glycoside hydrolase family 27 protein [Catenovulum maritimum]KMT65573.1 hypothetical protein XM47_07670 [Catenovulum maritimum]
MSFFNTDLAQTPPMGWNSWDCFSVSVTEDEVKANAKFIADNLKQYGWEYVVVDLAWFAPGAVHDNYKNKDIPQLIDENGRLIPCPEKFPSSVNGAGFKPLADYVHSLGLKFGIHIMRGIPVQAVEAKSPIKGTKSTADQVSYDREACPWYNSLRTLNFAHPDAKAYYESIVDLYKEWGVDYIKADDLNSWHEVENSDGSPTGTGSPYRIDDIEALSNAMRNCGRGMLLSLSPGGPETTIVNHLRNHANLWRISADFWDHWGSLKKQMERCAIWAPFITEGHWPDADMLPIGDLPRGESGGTNRVGNFNMQEMHTLMTLWSMARSPLMIGANLPGTDPAIIKLLQNADVLAVNQNSTANRYVATKAGFVIWRAQAKDGTGEYLAVMNTNDDMAVVSLTPSEVELSNFTGAKDLWCRYSAQVHPDSLSVELAAHDAVLFKI